jgi:uncharacterized BrkB/YihY/UPF0761 family membrane protein
VAILAGLWPATSYGAGLYRAFDALSPKSERELQGLRGRGLLLLIVLPVFILGGLISSYVGSQIIGTSGPARILGIVVALAAGFVAAAAAIGLIYWIFPRDRPSWKGIVRGTIVAGGGISVISLAFTLYLSLGSNFQEHYVTSGLAGVVLLAVWLFLANVLLLVGYEVALEN